jgi:predicted GNAT superfamily acetyltransferase
MYWTFDPLVARNAHLNVNVLGVRVVEYARDMYGPNQMSRTDSVIGSDRFVVAWELGGHGRSQAVTGGQSGHGRSQAVTGGQGGQLVIASESDPLSDAAVIHVAIPADIQLLKQSQPDAARAWRRSTRRAFEHYLGCGYTVRGVDALPGGGGSHYRLESAR